LNISRSWIALAHQLEHLTLVVKDEDAVSHSETRARGSDEQHAP